MAVRKYKPTTPGRRGASVSTFDELTRSTPEKSLVAKGRNKAGRNTHGRITARHQGGGTKRRYRVVDFRRNKDGVPAKVAHIEYDPNRSARIALLHYVDGEKRYIVAPQQLKVGDMVLSGPEAEIKPGNAMPLRSIPLGTFVYNVEMTPGKGGQIARGGRRPAAARRRRPAIEDVATQTSPAVALSRGSGDLSQPGAVRPRSVRWQAGGYGSRLKRRKRCANGDRPTPGDGALRPLRSS